jgi:GNAT superfamily N-acetyltransferase
MFLSWHYNSMIIQKQYARRDITGYKSPYSDPFEYRSIVEIGMDEVCRTMIPFNENKSAPDRFAQARIEFDELIEYAGTAYKPEYWYAATLGNKIIGVVFPQRYWDKMEEGSIFHIGVLPEHQGKGYGKILHAKGLETLATMGCTGYVGSTEIENARMISVFLANGCKLTAVREVERLRAGPIIG